MGGSSDLVMTKTLQSCSILPHSNLHACLRWLTIWFVCRERIQCYKQILLTFICISYMVIFSLVSNNVKSEWSDLIKLTHQTLNLERCSNRCHSYRIYIVIYICIYNIYVHIWKIKLKLYVSISLSLSLSSCSTYLSD